MSGNIALRFPALFGKPKAQRLISHRYSFTKQYTDQCEFRQTELNY
jgi:hypothetical protein